MWHFPSFFLRWKERFLLHQMGLGSPQFYSGCHLNFPCFFVSCLSGFQLCVLLLLRVFFLYNWKETLLYITYLRSSQRAPNLWKVFINKNEIEDEAAFHPEMQKAVIFFFKWKFIPWIVKKNKVKNRWRAAEMLLWVDAYVIKRLSESVGLIHVHVHIVFSFSYERKELLF